MTTLDFSTPKIMGILNITPDSFYEGSRYGNPDAALKKALQMQQEGADIIDVGGESSRPGSKAISIQEELDRVIPVIEKLTQNLAIPISIDTYKPEIMRAAINTGAALVNDIKALREPNAINIVKEKNVAVCLMHMQGEPRTMQQSPVYGNVVQEVYDFLAQRIQICLEAGIDNNKIIIDPGFGFGKTVEHNLQLIKNLSVFKKLNCPILIGVSRKSTLGAILNQPAEQRLYGSLVAAAIAINNGAQIIRTHDVLATHEIAQIAAALRKN